MASRPAPQKSIPQFHKPPKVGGKFGSSTSQGHYTVSWKVVSASRGVLPPKSYVDVPAGRRKSDFLSGGGLLSPKSYVDVPAGHRKSDYLFTNFFP